MPFESAWKVVITRVVFKSRRSSKKKRPIKSSSEYLNRLSPQSQCSSKRIHGEVIFFSVGEAATSRWTHGEMAVFGSTVYKVFALKCQKLRTPIASLAPCVTSREKSTVLEILGLYSWFQRKFKNGSFSRILHQLSSEIFSCVYFLIKENKIKFTSIINQHEQ